MTLFILHPWGFCVIIVCKQRYIYNIGVLTVNIEFMWRGLETAKTLALASLSIRAVLRNTSIL
jgi:hypothetical protein